MNQSLDGFRAPGGVMCIQYQANTQTGLLIGQML